MEKFTIPFLLFSILAVAAEETILHQRYVTSPSNRIQLDEVKANCQNSPLVSSLGHPLTIEEGVELKVVLSEMYGSCISRDQTMTEFALKIKASEIVECYNAANCGAVKWSSADMDYRPTCGENGMRLELNVYCKISPPLSLTSAPLASSAVPRNQEKCQDMTLKRARHIFTTSACAQPLRSPEQKRRELSRLAQQLNNCQAGCREVSLDEFNVTSQTPCDSQASVNTFIRVYWSCDDTATSQPNPSGRESTESQELPTTTTWGSAGKQGSSKGSLLGNSREMTYLIALVVVSVLLVLVILLLIGVLIFFKRIKARKHKRFSKQTASGPPSRQALYTTVSESVRLCEDGGRSNSARPSSHDSSVRYVASDSMEEAKVSDGAYSGAYSEYSIPLGDNYEEPEEDDTYEMVDTSTASKMHAQSMPQKKGSDKHSNSYAIPVITSAKPPTRTASEKYSDGYLVPTVSKGRNLPPRYKNVVE